MRAKLLLTEKGSSARQGQNEDTVGEKQNGLGLLKLRQKLRVAIGRSVESKQVACQSFYKSLKLLV